MQRVGHQWKVGLRLPLLVGCSQLFLSSNQIAEFFDQRYHLKEPISVLDFLHGDNHQGKVACNSYLGVVRCVYGPIG